MKHRINIFMLLMLAVSINIYAQKTESFDLSSFSIDKGWKKDIKTGVVSYTKTNLSLGGYCVIAVYQNIESIGSIDQDFDKEWKELISNRFTVKAPPQTNSGKRSDGWFSKAGAAAINDGNSDAIALLSVFNSTGRMISILVLMNKEGYMNEVDKFLSSLKLKAPPADNKANNIISAPSTSNSTGISISTTNFNDGWTSIVKNDYVLVEKGNNAVYLLYHVPYNASQFSGTGARDAEYYWDNYVTKYFSTQSKQFNDGGSIGLKPPYMEGYAVDRRTGRPCFIGMYLLIIPNAVSLVIGTASDETVFRKLYPKSNDPFGSDLASMTKYNKFAVAPRDVVGQWQEGGTSTAQWYYTSPAGYEGYAGMTAAATSATFNFNSNGSYTSIHNGAVGAVGSMNTYQQEYKGKYTVSNWQITATNRWNGKTETMPAHFEVVRGGRILHLGDYPRYKLVKVK